MQSSYRVLGPSQSLVDLNNRFLKSRLHEFITTESADKETQIVNYWLSLTDHKIFDMH